MATPSYTFNRSSALLLQTAIEAGITSPAELANLMGNAHVETAGFSTMHENFRYRSAERLIEAVSSADERFTRAQIDAAVASREPSRIATIMYENRRDLGNTEPGDGWRFHGRGYLQYTGRYNYAEYGSKFGVDLEGQPDLAAEPRMAARLAVAYWQDKIPEMQREDVRAAARRINGGENGMAARVAASDRWADVITADLVARVRDGRLGLEQLVGIGAPTREELASRSGPRALDHGEAQLRAVQAALNALGYRDANGRPLVVDGDLGPRTRQAVEAFQRDSGIGVDGRVGPQTLATLHRAQQAPLLSNPSHPDHALYRQALRGIEQLPAATFRNEGERSNAAATLAFEARVSGASRIDHVVLSQRGDGLFAVQGELGNPAHLRVYVDRAQAAAQPLERSTALLGEEAHRRQAALDPAQVATRQPPVEPNGTSNGLRH